MKKLILFVLTMVISSALLGQDNISLTFTRPSKFSGSAAKISVVFDEQEISLKNGASTSINLPLNSPRVIEIRVKAQLYKANYSLHAIPGEDYTFEVGFELRGVYITLISGKEDLLATSKVAEDSNYDWKSSIKTGQDGSIGLNAEKTHSSDAIRQEWLRKGGKVSYTSITGNATYFNVKVENYGSINGYGGGYSFFINNFNLKIPEYKPGITSWNSFNWGIGYDLVLYAMNYSYDEDIVRMNMSSFMVNLMLTGDFGWTLGVGKFKSQEQWKGVAFIVKYRPSLNLAMGSSTIRMTSDSPFIPSSETTANIDPTFNLNLGGFGFDFQISNFYATMNKLAPKPTMKLTAFVLPPIGDNPLFVSVGIGIIIYKRK